jgi:hypothetical protein
MIVVGVVNRNKCPVDAMIPLWLIGNLLYFPRDSFFARPLVFSSLWYSQFCFNYNNSSDKLRGNSSVRFAII